MFKPKLFETLKNYRKEQFIKDVLAGIIVGIVALPLAIAFAIASGVSPEKGLLTAIIAGFIVSLMGGSRVQIGGPTGAFIVIVYGIVQAHGVNGLIIATFIAGIMLIMMGLARLGTIIKFIPHPLIVGFTSGIALIIFSSQIKDFLGLNMGSVPVDFLDKWKDYGKHISSTNLYAGCIAISTMLIIVFWPRVTHKIPGSLVAILFTTAIVHFFNFPLETIGSRFGNIPSSFPSPAMPALDYATVKNLIQPAFTIALLCGIESLLSAVVADGMIRGNHKSNMELVAQGTANIFSSIFGGIPATGAIARTATNIKNGGRTPVAGIVHAVTLLLIMLFVGEWAVLIPMPTLAGILVMVAYNMSEWESFLSVARGPRRDAAVLIITFILTVLVDLVVAIEIGMVLATFLFMHKMMKLTEVNILAKETETSNDEQNENGQTSIPKEVEVFEITGPFFFGAAYKFKDAMKEIQRSPKVFIIRMSKVSIIDATGIRTIEEVHKELKHKGIKLILAEVSNVKVLEELRNARLLFAIGKANVVGSFEKALERCNKILQDEKYEKG